MQNSLRMGSGLRSHSRRHRSSLPDWPVPRQCTNNELIDINNDVLAVQQNKTGKRLRIEITGDLAVLLSRIAERKKGYAIHTLILICTDKRAKLRAIKLHPELTKEINAFHFRE